MALELSRLFVRIGADIGDLDRKMRAAEKSISRAGDRFEDVGRKLSLGISAPLTAIGAGAVAAGVKMDSLVRGLTSVTGSAEKTNEQLDRLREVAKLPGLGFEEAIQGSVRLQAAGFSAELAEAALTGFGNALASVGGSKADLDAITRALSQIAAKGKISAQEINQLAENLPQIRVLMQRAFGTSNTEALQAQSIGATEFVTKITAELNKLGKVTGGIKNDFENLSDALKAAGVAISREVLPVIGPMIEKFTDWATAIAKASPDTLKWAVSLAAVAAALGPLISGSGTLLQTLALVKTASLLTAATMGWIGVAVVAIGALSAAFIKWKLDATTAADEVAKAGEKALAAFAKMPAAQRKAAMVARAKQIDADIGSAELTQQNLQSAGMTSAAKRKGEEIVALRAELAKLTAAYDQIGQKADNADGSAADSFDKAFAALTSVAEAGIATGAEIRKLTKLEEQFARQAHDGTLLTEKRAEAYERMVKASAALVRSRTLTPQQELDRGSHIVDTRTTQPIIRTAGPSISTAASDKRELARARFDLNDQPFDKFAEGAISRGPAAGAFQFQAAFGGITELIESFSPLGIAATALTGLFDGLKPVLDALKEPLRVVGEIFGKALAPILKALFPIFKNIAVSATYVGQIFFKVAEGVAKGIGYIIYGIAKAIDKIIPFFDPLKGVEKLGQQIINFGDGLGEASTAMAEGRDELKNLNWEDAYKPAADAAENFGEKLNNVASGFKTAKRRFESTSVVGDRTAVARGGVVIQGDVHVHGVEDPKGLTDAVETESRRRSARGGVGLSLSYI